MIYYDPEITEALRAEFETRIDRKYPCWLIAPKWREWPGQSQRLAWRMANGEVPRNMKVVAGCGSGRCVNPAHLRIAYRKNGVEKGFSPELVAAVLAEKASAPTVAKNLMVTTQTVLKIREAECLRQLDEYRAAKKEAEKLAKGESASQ